MTVGELINKLKEYDEEDEVLCSTYQGQYECLLKVETIEGGIDNVYVILEDV